MSAPERSPERDAALAAALAHVPRRGWGWAAVAAGLEDGGMAPEAARLEAELLFPGGTIDLVEAFVDRMDRDMAALAEGEDFAGLRVSRRVRALVLGRLATMAPHREAVRRAMGVLARPRHARVAACSLARTVDRIWVLAGDEAADWSRHSKRAILAGVYSATLLFWLRDDSEGGTATEAFLDRRLAGVARMGKLRGRIEERLGGLWGRAAA